MLALAALRLAVDRALEDSKCLLSDVRAVCLGLAGISSAAEGNDVANEVRHKFPAGIPIAVYNDAVTALAAGTGGKLLGCSIIVGTGVGLYRRQICCVCECCSLAESLTMCLSKSHHEYYILRCPCCAAPWSVRTPRHS